LQEDVYGIPTPVGPVVGLQVMDGAASGVPLNVADNAFCADEALSVTFTWKLYDVVAEIVPEVLPFEASVGPTPAGRVPTLVQVYGPTPVVGAVQLTE
jgi:hypothetical protein